jgi:acyl transferase domain-containing protein
VRPVLGVRLSLAANNGPALCVVAGDLPAIASLEGQLRDRGITGRRLPVSHAFHSAMVEPALPGLVEHIRQTNRAAPTIPFLSNVTGAWITPDEATDPHYWARHARQTVRFTEGVNCLLGDPRRILLEVGPGQTLSTLVRLHPAKAQDQLALPSLPRPDDAGGDIAQLMDALGRLWLSGVEVDWPAIHAHHRRQRVPLPPYPFQRQRYWAETDPSLAESVDGPRTSHGRCRTRRDAATVAPAAGAVRAAPPTQRPGIEESVATIWRDVLGLERVGLHDDFFDLGGNSVFIPQVVARLNDMFHVQLSPINLFESPTVAGLAECIEAVYQFQAGARNCVKA